MTTCHNERVATWFAQLRDRLCDAFEAIEAEAPGDAPPARFERHAWERPGGGGGEMALMRGMVPVF
ncbi:MAG: hypothetical protein HQL40_17275 [Alphaproteobacteria bacterium]|nr:hypothetical protein [Alphaproteobacteria bacterium]